MPQAIGRSEVPHFAASLLALRATKAAGWPSLTHCEDFA